MTDFGADAAFGKVPQKLREHYGIEVPLSAAQIITKQHAATIKQERVRLERLPRGGVQQLIGELDGSMLPIVSIAARALIQNPARFDWEPLSKIDCYRLGAETILQAPL